MHWVLVKIKFHKKFNAIENNMSNDNVVNDNYYYYYVAAKAFRPTIVVYGVHERKLFAKCEIIRNVY